MRMRNTRGLICFVLLIVLAASLLSNAATLPGGTMVQPTPGSDACVLSNGSCSVSYTQSAAGTPIITAAYGGDTTGDPPSSGTFDFSTGTISPGATEISCSPSSTQVGTTVACTATVTSSILSSIPTGIVIWSSDVAGTFGVPVPLIYQILQTPTSVPLFEIYKQVVYNSPLELIINSNEYFAHGSEFPSGYTGDLTGYQEFTYVVTDRLGNSVFIPMDVDIANTVIITLNVAASVAQDNSNKTTIDISGQAGSYANLGTQFIPLANNDIYLYYGPNIDFNGMNPKSTNPGESEDAILCAVNLTNPSGGPCIPYNPVWPANASMDSAGNLYNPLDYAPSYNSLGDCNMPANSLLEQGYTKCNIYDEYSLASTCPNTGVLSYCKGLFDSTPCPPTQLACHDDLETCTQQSGYAFCEKLPEYASYGSCIASYSGLSPQYCLPLYVNGTGGCTSQLGLFAVDTTNAIGGFNSIITACGTAQGEVMTAAYYGYPAPEPIKASVVPLALVANNVWPNYPAVTPLAVSELNYSQAPAIAQSTFNIGVFELSYNSLSLLAVLTGIAIALLLLVWGSVRHGEARGRGR